MRILGSYDVWNAKYFTHFKKDVSYLGSYNAEEFAGFNYKTIEWVKVRPHNIPYEMESGLQMIEDLGHDIEKI